MKKQIKQFHKKYNIKSWITSSDKDIENEMFVQKIDVSNNEFREYLYNLRNCEFAPHPHCNNNNTNCDCKGHEVCDCLIAIEPDEGTITTYYRSEENHEIINNKRIQTFNYCPFCGKEIEWLK